MEDKYVYRKCIDCGIEFKTLKQGGYKKCTGCLRKNPKKKIKLKNKECPICGKVFKPKNTRQVYCNTNCTYEAHLQRQKSGHKPQDDQLCWTCAKACGDCSWSDRTFTPIEGWKTTESRYKYSGVSGYHIIECPEYINDGNKNNRSNY